VAAGRVAFRQKAGNLREASPVWVVVGDGMEDAHRGYGRGRADVKLIGRDCRLGEGSTGSQSAGIGPWYHVGATAPGREDGLWAFGLILRLPNPRLSTPC